jgi:hypothetical protein
MVLRELLARFGIDFETDKINAGAAGVEGLVSKIKTLAVAVAGSALVVGVSRFVNEISQMGAELEHTATMLGMTAEELLEWRRAAEISGASAQDVTSAIQSVQGQMKSALTGGEDAIRMFARLGVSIYKSGGGMKTASDVFEEISGRLGGVTNETERAMIATALLGGAGANLHGLFRLGAEGISDLRAEVHELAAVDMRAFTESSTEVRGAISRFGVVLDSLKMKLAISLFPTLTAVIDAITRAVVWFRELTQGTHALEAAIIVLVPVVAYFARAMIQAGLRVALAWAPLILQTALIAAAIALVVLIVDDLIALFTGGRSVIGDFIDQLFGAGTAAELVETCKLAVASLVEWLGVAWEKAKEWGAIFLEVLGQVAGFLKDTFGPAFEAAKRFFTELQDLGLEVARALKDALGSIWGFVVDEITRRLGAMRDLVVKVAEFFGIDFQDVKDAAAGAARLAADGLEASFNVGARAANAGANALRQYNNRVDVGGIVVNGAGDPEETARAVADELRRQNEAAYEEAYGDLVPVGG